MSTPQTGGGPTAPLPQISKDDIDKPIQDKIDGLQRESQLGESQFITVEIDTQATDGYDELHHETQSKPPQLSSVEIDTQATDGYDEAEFDVEALMHASNTLNALPMCHNPKPRYQILELPDEPLNFKYENPNIKPNMQTAVQPRPPLSTAGKTVIQAHDSLKNHHRTENVAQREVIPDNVAQVSITAGESDSTANPNLEKNKSLPKHESDARKQPVLRPKDPNIRQISENTSFKLSQKQGFGPVTDPVNSHWPKQVQEQPEPIRLQRDASPPFQDIEPLVKKRRGPRLPSGKPCSRPGTGSETGNLPSPLSMLQTVANQSSSAHPETKRIEVPETEIQHEHAMPQQSAVDNKLIGNHISGAPLVGDMSSTLFTGDGLSFDSQSQRQAHPHNINGKNSQIPQNPNRRLDSEGKQGNGVGLHSNHDTQNVFLSPNARSTVPFPDMVYNADQTPARQRSQGQVNRPLSVNKRSAQVVGGPLNALKVTKTKKSVQKHQVPGNLPPNPQKNSHVGHAITTHQTSQPFKSNAVKWKENAGGIIQEQGLEITGDSGDQNLQKDYVSLNTQSSRALENQMGRDKRQELAPHSQVVQEYDTELVSDVGLTSPPPQQLIQQLQRSLEEEKGKLSQRMHRQASKIDDLSKQNEAYEAKIDELTRTICSLRESIPNLSAKTQMYKNRVESLLEDYKAVKEFVLNNKSDTAACRQQVQEMSQACTEADKKCKQMYAFQAKARVILKEAGKLLQDRNASEQTLRRDLQECLIELQQETLKYEKLQQQLDEHSKDTGLKDSIKTLLDDYHIEISSKLANQETKLTEVINNVDGENQKRLAECLKVLGLIKESEPKVPTEVLNLMDLVTSLSASISERLQSADDDSASLRNAGSEVMEALKVQVKSMLTDQDAQRELNERIFALQLSNSRLENAARGHEEKIPYLQAQLNDRQKELNECSEELRLKVDELQQARAKLQDDSVLRGELSSLQAAIAKVTGDHAEAVKRFENAQVALRTEANKTQSVIAEKSALKERLQAAEVKIASMGKELSQTKADATELFEMQRATMEQQRTELEEQRTKMEEEKRRSLEKEQRTHVQKVSNLQRLLGDSQAESNKLKADAEKDHQVILSLKAEFSALETNSSKQAERLVQLEERSNFNQLDYESLLEAMQSRTFDISQIEMKLKEHEERSAFDSGIVNKMEESVGKLTGMDKVIRSRLDFCDKAEMKVRNHCTALGISYDSETIDGVLEKIASFRGPEAIEYESQPTVIDVGHRQILDNDGQIATLASTQHSLDFPGFGATPLVLTGVEHLPSDSDRHPHSTFIPAKITEPMSRVQVLKSPEVQDSQISLDQSQSPIPMRRGRRIAERRSTMIREVTTETTTVRKSRTVQERETRRRTPGPEHTPMRGSVVEDSQDKETRFIGDSNDSPMTDITAVVDFIDDNPKEDHSQVLDHQRGQKGVSARKLKSCMKRPRNYTGDKQVLSSDPIRASPVKPVSKTIQAGQPYSKHRLASIRANHDLSKGVANKSLERSKVAPSSATENPTKSALDEDPYAIPESPTIVPPRNGQGRKRTRSSMSTETISERASKSRISLPLYRSAPDSSVYLPALGSK